MMNQTKKHTTGKKLLALLLALIMTISLLPMSVFAAEPGTEETPVVEGQTEPAAEAGADDADQAQKPDADEANEDEAPVDEGEGDAVLPGDAEGDADDADVQAAEDDGIAAFAATDATVQYKILHLDCGRKYFSKEWIIALLNEMSAAGYNQLELAFGNDGFRFVLDNMAVGTYASDAVKAAIEVGNKAYYDEGTVNALTQTDMDAIIARANELKIDIVPLFNTPFHMNALITAMGELGIQSAQLEREGRLNLGNDTAVDFVKALMQKYITYFADKGCDYFNFGADEYESWSNTFYTYAGEIASMIHVTNMKTRVFNDSYRSNGGSTISGVDAVCYWTSGSDYATTKTVSRSASVINTNQDYYYVVNDSTQQSNWSPNAYYTFSGTYDEATWISHALTFSNTTYKNHGNTNSGASSVSPVGSMFCVWCDNPSHKDQTQIAKEIRMILRVMAARMDGKDTYSTNVVVGGFNANGTINGSSSGGTDPVDPNPGETTTTVNVELKVGETQVIPYKTADDPVSGKYEISGDYDKKVASVTTSYEQESGGINWSLTAISTSGLSNNASAEGVLSDGKGNFIKITGTTIGNTTDPAEATTFTVTKSWNGYSIKVTGTSNYLNQQRSYSNNYSLVVNNSSSASWSVGNGNDFYQGNYRILAISGEAWGLSSQWANQAFLYKLNSDPKPDIDQTSITFKGLKTGTTQVKIGEVTYNITVTPKVFNVTLEESDSVTYDVGNEVISKMPDPKIATAAVSGGKLTLTGMKASDKTTTCTVGDTQYVITVVEKSTGTGSNLYVDLWVTNHGVLPTDGDPNIVKGETGTGNRRVTVQYDADKFAGVEGKLLIDVLPNAGTDTVNSQTARYWKTRYLPLATRQMTADWTNKSGYGTDVKSGPAGGEDIERIRYYGGKWSYLPVDGTEWIDFNTSNSNMVTLEETGAQIAAYYLLKTTVTKEVTTYITDWPDDHNTGTTAIYGVALDYCVKYLNDSTTRYPDTFGNSNANTHWFNCDGTINGLADQNGYTVEAVEANAAGWKGLRTNAKTYSDNSYDDCYRVINNIEAVDTDEYEVYMITTTPSESFTLQGYTQCPDEIVYPTTGEEVIWAIDDQAVTDSGLDKHAELVVGGTPRVDRVMIQQCSGLLLTYYVRAKASVDNLHVNYYDKDSGLLIHTYDIIPHATQKPNDFSGFMWDENDYGKGITSGNEVINNEGKSITVQTDLKKVSGIAGKYQVGFELVEINKTTDNKTLNLYYTLQDSYSYVVDFGVPAKVKRFGTAAIATITADDTTLYESGATTKKEATRTNGKLYVDSNGDLYYQLTTMKYDVEKVDTFNVTYTYKDTGAGTGTTDNSNTYTVTFIPASNVYYEDDGAFMTFTPGMGTAAGAVWNEEFDDPNSKTPAESQQIAEALNAAGNNVYGTDPTYANSTKFSLGRAHKVTVSANMVTNWNDNTCRWPTAEFTFKGTGFDVISLTDNKSGLLTYKVEQWDETNKTWKTERQRFVSNYYGLDKDGNVVSADKDNALYQLPVVKVDGLPYGTYRVTLIVAYGAIFDKTGLDKYSFWLDGVRIYDPAGTSLDNTYAKDGEGWPKYIELHDELVKKTDFSTTLFIEGKEQASIEEYTSYGPNHEVYLLPGQTIAFKLDDVSNVDKVQIGAKAPMGKAVLKVGDGVVAGLETATDMYYDITKYAITEDGTNKTAQTVTITNGGDTGTILSLTQLKVTHKDGTKKASLAILNESEQQEALAMVRAMYAPVEPEVFVPERFEASWNRSTVKVGQKATLTVKTSTDVDTITVDGVTVTNYRTRTQRTGWGWNATKVTYREFTYTVTAAEAGTLDVSVVAVNADGVNSEPITAALTVQAVQRPQRPSWLDKIFSRWF